MTAYVSAASGNFGDNSTWTPNTGHPSVNGDTFTIGSSHIVTMDTDTSALTGFGASAINGTLQFKRTAGTYILKMNGNLTGTGIIDMSDGAGGAIPAGVIAEILFNSTANSNALSGVQNIICLEPTYRYVRLTSPAIAGATVLNVDTDLTGEATYWKLNDLVRVDNISQGVQSEQYTISSVSSTQLTLTAGLTNAKLAGSYVVLVSRNVKIVGAGTGGGTAFNAPGQNSIIAAEIRNIASGIVSFTKGTVGGVISGVTTALSSCTGLTVNACISGAGTGLANASGGCTFNQPLTGCTNAISAAANCVINSVIAGATNALNSAANITLTANALLIGCLRGVNLGSGVIGRGATLSSNSRDIDRLGCGTFYNTLLSSTTEFLNYTDVVRLESDYVESIDHDQVAGAFRAWTLGGITTSVSSPVYDSSRVRSYQVAPESATYRGFMQRQALVPPGGSIYVRCYVQKDSSMAYLPRLWVFSADKEPFISGSPNAEVIMTNSLNTWEVLEATVTNSTNAPVLYIIRTLAKNATGLVYFDPLIRTSIMMLEAGLSGGLVAA